MATAIDEKFADVINKAVADGFSFTSANRTVLWSHIYSVFTQRWHRFLKLSGNYSGRDGLPPQVDGYF